MELTLLILGSFLEHGPSLSLRQLCRRAEVPEEKVRFVLSVLERRGYLRRVEDTGEYVLDWKIVMFV